MLMSRSLRAAVLCAGLASVVSAPASAAEQGKIGIVLMHGELGSPGRIIGNLGAALEQAGYLVARPDMCWSGRRGYEASFPDCLAAVDDAIVKLKNLGATSIVVGGFSLGGTAAIAYGAAHLGLMGIMAIAPAHDAKTMIEFPDIARDVDRARDLVAQGKGDAQGDFDDADVGPDGVYVTDIATTPAIYLSFFGPDSSATWAKNLPRVTAPLFWVVGSDHASEVEAQKMFALARPSPVSHCLTVAAAPLAVPDKATDAVLVWLKNLPPPP
jgi:pimeloyl-ACP methyl ester carboxylesterase